MVTPCALEHKLFNISKYYKNLQVCYIALAFCLAGMALRANGRKLPIFLVFEPVSFIILLMLNSTHYISSFFYYV